MHFKGMNIEYYFTFKKYFHTSIGTQNCKEFTNNLPTCHRFSQFSLKFKSSKPTTVYNMYLSGRLMELFENFYSSIQIIPFGHKKNISESIIFQI